MQIGIVVRQAAPRKVTEGVMGRHACREPTGASRVDGANASAAAYLWTPRVHPSQSAVARHAVPPRHQQRQPVQACPRHGSLGAYARRSGTRTRRAAHEDTRYTAWARYAKNRSHRSQHRGSSSQYKGSSSQYKGWVRVPPPGALPQACAAPPCRRRSRVYRLLASSSRASSPSPHRHRPRRSSPLL